MALKISINNIIEESKFILRISFYTDEIVETTFAFGNVTKGFQRNHLFLENAQREVLKPDLLAFITPARTPGYITPEGPISISKKFVYDLKGEIEQNELRVVIDFLTTGWILEKGQTYYMYIFYKESKSNELEIRF